MLPRRTHLVTHGREKGGVLLLTAPCMLEELCHDGIRNYSADFEGGLKMYVLVYGLHFICCVAQAAGEATAIKSKCRLSG